MQGADIIRRVDERIRNLALFVPGERIVAAVSGGPDSMALLHILHRLSEQWEWKIAIAHINHGLRGGESDEEEHFVKGSAADLGLEFYAERVQVKEALFGYGNNLQTAARELRYEALRRIAEASGSQGVALGHHADDQAETVLMRILRGTGPGGLSGIRDVRYLNGLKLVRPLLRISKSELEAYCLDNGLEFRKDSSNDSRKYFRNVVRLDILPYLMKHRPGLTDSLIRLAQISADESDLLDAEAGELVKRLTERTEHGIKGERIAISNVHIALQRRMFKIILSCLGTDASSIDFLKIEQMREAMSERAPSNSELRLTEQLFFRRNYNVVEWTAQSKPPVIPYEYGVHLSKDGKLFIKEANVCLGWKTVSAGEGDGLYGLNSDSCAAVFDADKFEGQVVVRSRRAGDKLEPHGLKGSKKVKDMFIDLKVPPDRRERWPILADSSGTLLWIPGMRRSRHALVGQHTRRVLFLWVEGNFFA